MRFRDRLPWADQADLRKDRDDSNPSQLNQVFLNLINNAAQAIPGNGKSTVRTSVEDLRVRVDIIDTGSGISSTPTSPPNRQAKAPASDCRS